MITKRDFILRGSCFYEKYNMNPHNIIHLIITVNRLQKKASQFIPYPDMTLLCISQILRSKTSQFIYFFLIRYQETPYLAWFISMLYGHFRRHTWTSNITSSAYKKEVYFSRIWWTIFISFLPCTFAGISFYYSSTCTSWRLRGLKRVPRSDLH